MSFCIWSAQCRGVHRISALLVLLTENLVLHFEDWTNTSNNSDKYILQSRQIQYSVAVHNISAVLLWFGWQSTVLYFVKTFSSWWNRSCNFYKYILQYGHIHFAIRTNTLRDSDKYILNLLSSGGQQVHKISGLLVRLTENRAAFCSLDQYIF